MKKINKGEPPDELKQWRADNADVPENLFYGLAGFPKGKVLEALLKEQGNICAYTLKRLCPSSSHVEHLKPQTECNKEDLALEEKGRVRLHEDIAWGNMVACFPGPNPPARPDYGAVKKGRWWNLLEFVSPLQVDCEGRFRFFADGKISASVATDLPAKTTIVKIGLDNSKLEELRKEAYLRAGVHRRAVQPITSVAKVEQLIAKWSNRDANTESYVEFCVPLIQVAMEYANFLRTRGYGG